MATFENSMLRLPSKSLDSSPTVNCPPSTVKGTTSSWAAAFPTLENISSPDTTVCCWFNTTSNTCECACANYRLCELCKRISHQNQEIRLFFEVIHLLVLVQGIYSTELFDYTSTYETHLPTRVGEVHLCKLQYKHVFSIAIYRDIVAEWRSVISLRLIQHHVVRSSTRYDECFAKLWRYPDFTVVSSIAYAVWVSELWSSTVESIDDIVGMSYLWL